MAEQIHSVTIIGNASGYTLPELATDLIFYADTCGNLYVTTDSYFQFIGWNKSLRKSSAWATTFAALLPIDLLTRLNEIHEINTTNAANKAVQLLDENALQQLHKLWAEMNKRGLLGSKNFKWYIHSLQLTHALQDAVMRKKLTQIVGWENFTYQQWKKVENFLAPQLPPNWASHLTSFPESVLKLALAEHQIVYPFTQLQTYELAKWFTAHFYQRFSTNTTALLDSKNKRRYNGLKRSKSTGISLDLATEIALIERLIVKKSDVTIWDELAPIVREIAIEAPAEKQQNQLSGFEKIFHR